MKSTMKSGINFLVTAIVFSLLSNAALAYTSNTCPYDDDFKFVLKKAISGYLRDPSNAAVTRGDVNDLIGFYFGTPDTATADCSVISDVIDRVNVNFPDNVIPAPSKRSIVVHCASCADSTPCGGKNSKDQECECMDMNGDGRYEICHLDPVISAINHCTECWDGTKCGEKNVVGLKCKCSDINSDTLYELCFLRPEPPGPMPPDPGPGPTPTCSSPAECKNACDDKTEANVGRLSCDATETCCVPLPSCPETCKASCDNTEIPIEAICDDDTEVCCLSLPGPGPIPPMPPGPGPGCFPPAECKDKCDDKTEDVIVGVDCGGTKVCCIPLPTCPEDCKASCDATEVQVGAICGDDTEVCCLSLPPIPPGPMPPVPPGPIPPGPGPGPTPTCTSPAVCKNACDDKTEFNVGKLNCDATETCCLPLPSCPETCKASCDSTEVQMPAACSNANDVCCVSLPPMPPVPPGPTPPGPVPPGPGCAPPAECKDKCDDNEDVLVGVDCGGTKVCCISLPG
ncbi:MAG: hypothetical protein U9Q22_00080 [Candidatus Altiarchaeota archaeon]|nr:hypothetical protein [Candidatus Altiarchaeota archaeon]